MVNPCLARYLDEWLNLRLCLKTLTQYTRDQYFRATRSTLIYSIYILKHLKYFKSNIEHINFPFSPGPFLIARHSTVEIKSKTRSAPD